jgi:hypothetical protein
MALAVAGCAANSTGKTGANTTTAPTNVGAPTTTTTGTAVGVTPTTIKLGIAMINFACIPKAFIDEERPKQQAGYQAYVDEINEHGGINGRKIVGCQGAVARGQRWSARRRSASARTSARTASGSSTSTRQSRLAR